MKNVDYESFIPYIAPPELKDHAFLSGLDSIKHLSDQEIRDKVLYFQDGVNSIFGRGLDFFEANASGDKDAVRIVQEMVSDPVGKRIIFLRPMIRFKS